MDDAALLLSWRNDPVTRSMSLSTLEIDWQTHINWLADKLNSDSPSIYIAHQNGIAIGSIRTVHANNSNEISWVVAPEHRRKGLGKQMMREFTERFLGTYTATIRIENLASQIICTFAGFTETSRDDSVIYYKNL